MAVDSFGCIRTIPQLLVKDLDVFRVPLLKRVNNQFCKHPEYPQSVRLDMNTLPDV